jgi:hypothetical protein
VSWYLAEQQQPGGGLKEAEERVLCVSNNNGCRQSVVLCGTDTPSVWLALRAPHAHRSVFHIHTTPINRQDVRGRLPGLRAAGQIKRGETEGGLRGCFNNNGHTHRATSDSQPLHVTRHPLWPLSRPLEADRRLAIQSRSRFLLSSSWWSCRGGLCCCPPLSRCVSVCSVHMAIWPNGLRPSRSSPTYHSPRLQPINRASGQAACSSCSMSAVPGGARARWGA